MESDSSVPRFAPPEMYRPAETNDRVFAVALLDQRSRGKFLDPPAENCQQCPARHFRNHKKFAAEQSGFAGFIKFACHDRR